MKALVLERHGPADVFAFRDWPEKLLEPGEVSLRVQHAGLNFADVAARVGLYPDAPPPPTVLGYEAAGIIEAVGPHVTLRPGQRAVALTHFGGQAERVTVPENHVFAVPASVDLRHAAALPVNYLTAYHMLHNVLSLRPGMRLLVHMAAGGVGLAVIDLCRSFPGLELFGTASAAKHAVLSAKGLHHPIDYRTQDYAERIRALTKGRGVDAVLNPLGGNDWGNSYELLAPSGHMVCFGWSNIVSGSRRNLLAAAFGLLRMPRFSPARLMKDNRTVSGVNLGGLWRETGMIQRTMTTLIRKLEAGDVRPHVDRTFPLAQGAQAHRYMQSRANVGKVLLSA
ncbi:MAG: synaptic vesicle VAT-1 family membrane protein [Myxococcaceae bacterium]